MDIDNEESFTKKCYKCDEQALDKLHIVYNSSNSKTLLWNKFQIFLYENLEFEFPAITFVPEFQIYIVIASNNYLVCIDCNGNAHITSLKFKNSTQKKLKIPFQPREKCIKTSLQYKDDYILSLIYDADTYFLCLHRINSTFQLEKKILLVSNEEHWPLPENLKIKYLLTSHSVGEASLEQLKKLLNLEESIIMNYELVVLTFDKLTVYACLFSPKMVEVEITLVKLYSCPAEICSIEIIDTGELHLLISLTMGTVIRLCLNDLTKSPDIIHLNTALYKIAASKETLLYSDGSTLWKAENMFSRNIQFTQLFIRNTNDFVKCGDQIICTTFSKLIYKFSIEDKTAYLISKTADEYCSAEELFNNSEYLNKLFEEIDKNNELVKKLSREEDYITALALANRSDVVNQAIETNVIVFERFSEASDTEFTLTAEIKEYFEPETWLLLVSITNSNFYITLNRILSNLIDNTRIYITLSTLHRILKTTCIKMVEPLKAVHYLLPISIKDDQAAINMNIKLVVNIPGALDRKKSWTVLYKKNIVLTSEHFIKTVNISALNSLKKPKESIDELLSMVNRNQYGNIFKFTDISKLVESEDWSFYVKLPNNYEQKFTSNNYCRKYLSSTKADSLIQQWSAEEFLKSKSQLIFAIGNEKLKIKIHNDGFSNPLLKVTGANAKTVYNIRNFFANMIYNGYEDHEPGKEFISYTFYTTTENLQKAVKECIKTSTLEEILPLMDQFEKNIIGALPL